MAVFSPQIPETAGFDVAAHVRALGAHGLDVDVVLGDAGALPLGEVEVTVVDAPLARADRSARESRPT